MSDLIKRLREDAGFDGQKLLAADALEAAIDRIAVLTVKCGLLAASLDKADLEVDALKADATRYRHLRENALFTFETDETVTLSFRRFPNVQHGIQAYVGEVFDADVDRAVDGGIANAKEQG